MVSKWTYKANEREYSLTEKVLSYEEPDRFESVFENEFAENTVSNRFTERGRDQTLWVAETKYKFKTLLMIMLGRLRKRYVARSREIWNGSRKCWRKHHREGICTINKWQQCHLYL